MLNENKTKETNNSVVEFLTTVQDPQTLNDCNSLVKIMTDISGCPPKMWGPSIVGFNKYHYKYESGREGDSCVIGFSPRKGKITVYVVDGTVRYSELLAKLGKHSTGKVCIYFKLLGDIDEKVLTEILRKSYAYTKSMDGNMHRAEH